MGKVSPVRIRQNVTFFQFTKAPLDGFEQQFGAYLQKKLFMRQRNQTR
ncbi:hypothetical protein OU798_08450 [Prolixibacteraceae bacterium Z1-6]|uniref:Uncharacterized protein n=1 Tax=Draconibacterium aestuarii TaxID=2998507 RepID=A0A9X3F4G2_9BACT|nr:hypothetical protein [Prolixibacteraceae bacterium Z1-6]